jgi:magnesium transporter
VLRLADGTLRTDLAPRELFEAVQQTGAGTTLWVDIDATQHAQHALLEKLFRLHPLAIEDTLNPNSRVKYEEYDGYLFVIARAVRFCDETEDPYDIETDNICFVLGPHWLVTVRQHAMPMLDEVAERLRRNGDVLARGPARVMHAILDLAVDAFFPILDRVDDFVDGLEERVFVQEDQSAIRDIFAVKRLVLTMRRHLSPQREVVNQLTNRPTPLIASATQLYFRDVYDHVLRINDNLDNYRELLSSTLDSYLSQVSNRLARSSQTLGVVATVTLPFVIVSGMWGMNFERIPLSAHPYGFWILLLGQVLVVLGMLGVLRWRRVI